jgi:nucleotide-binding universal stress UspA family protein
VHRSDEEFWEFAELEPGARFCQAVDSLPVYLDTMSNSPSLKRLHASTEICTGDIAQQIVEAAERGETHMIVISSRGKGGATGAGNGSVADKLVRTLAVPVMVVPPGCAPEKIEAILVPLDGSSTAERALGPARQLAQATGATIHLLRVINLSSDWRIEAGDEADLLDHLTGRAEQYLARIAEPGELPVALRGHPSMTIREYARGNHCQLIAMATHGWSGPIRTELGSTADDVVRLSDRPVLLIRAR